MSIALSALKKRLAEFHLANQTVISRLNRRGAWLIASVPPANTKSYLPQAMSKSALSKACIPEAQFLCTV